MMIRQLGTIFLAAISVSMFQTGSCIPKLIGTELKLDASAALDSAGTSITSEGNLDRLLVLEGIEGRAFDLDLRGGKRFRLPIKRMCAEGCPADAPINCQLSPAFRQFEPLENGDEDENENENEEESDEDNGNRGGRGFRNVSSFHGHDSLEVINAYGRRFFGRFAAGCVSGGQAWVNILNHRLDKEICHTAPTLARGERVMLTANDNFNGHYYYYEPATQEVCMMQEYYYCREGRQCPRPVCRRMSSPVTALAAFSMPDSSRSSVLVGCQNGQTILLVDMRPFSVYTPSCSCQDCTPIPISISACVLSQRVYILYQRCNRGNFLSVVGGWFPRDESVTPRIFGLVSQPFELATIRTPSIFQTAISCAQGVLYLTGSHDDQRYFVYAMAISRGTNGPVFANNGNAEIIIEEQEFAIISSAELRGVPTAQHVSAEGHFYAAVERSRMGRIGDARIVDIELSGEVEADVNGHHVEFDFHSRKYVVDKYILAPVGPTPFLAAGSQADRDQFQSQEEEYSASYGSNESGEQDN